MFPPPDTDLEAKDMVPKGSFRWTYIWAAPALVILVPCICWSQDDAAGKPACTATWDCPQNGLSASCECNAADNTESCSYHGGSCQTVGSCCKQSVTNGINCSEMSCSGRPGNQTQLRPKSWIGCTSVASIRNSVPSTLLLASLSAQPATGVPESFGIVKISNPTNAPLGISDIRYSLSPQELNKVSVSVENLGDQKVVAYELWWDIYSGDSVRRIPVYADNWISPTGLLAPRASIREPVRFSVGGKDVIQRVVVTVAYLELGDGSRFGPDAKDFNNYLVAKRTRIIEVYGRALAALQSGGEVALRSFLRPSISDDAFQGTAKQRLLEAIGSGGLVSFNAEVSRVRNLRP